MIRWTSQIRAIPYLILLAACVHAQQFAFHKDSQNEGLGSLTVNCLLQDRNGMIWVGTENGLYQFDGTSYTRIGEAQGLLASYINSVYEAPSGELWIGTTTNLFHGDGKQFAPVAGSSDPIPGSPGQQFASTGPGSILAVSKNRLLHLTRNGSTWSAAPYFSAETLVAFPQLTHISGIYSPRDGELWMGCSGAICRVSGDEITVWDEKRGVAKDAWPWFLEDSSGRLWARGFNHVRLLPQGAAEFENEDIPGIHDTFTSSFVPIVEDARHRILTRTNQGLAVWSDNRWQTYGAANGLNVPGILSMLVDRDGVLWLGTFGKGVERWLGYSNWETWTAGQGPSDNPVVWSLLRDRQKTLWAATESGIVQFDAIHNAFVPWRPGEFGSRQQVFSMLESRDGDIWFSSAGRDLDRFTPKTGAMKHWRVDSLLRLMRQDSTGRIWILAGEGPFLYNQAADKIEKVADPAIPRGVFYDMCEDPQHSLWFASTAGLIRLNQGNWSQVKVPGIVAPDGFSAVACAADGSLWLSGSASGAYVGVFHLRTQNGAVVSAETGMEELGSVEVMFTRMDHRGWLWVGTGSGVYVFNGSRWRHLTEQDGLSWNECDENAFLEDSDGSVWIGTANGLSHILRPEELFAQHPLRVLSVDAAVGDQPIPVDGSASFAWTPDVLRVRIVASAFEDESSLIYHYRLIGLEKNWNASRSQNLRYPALPSGAYRLEIFVEDANQGTNTPLTVLAFRVRPPWWRSLPFAVAAAALLIALAFVLLRFRERHIMARQARLESLVLERTAELKAKTEELEQEKQQLLEAREALREQASRDALTGLLNHGAILDALECELARIQRDGRALTVVMIDIDHFKQVNDEYGHVAGDHVLRELASRLTNAIRPYDFAGRYGGEEFLLIMPDFDAALDQDRLAAIHDAMCLEPIQAGGQQVRLTCSLGVSTFSGDRAMVPERLVDHADKALYMAKDRGRNRIEYDQA